MNKKPDDITDSLAKTTKDHEVVEKQDAHSDIIPPHGGC